MDHKIKFLRDPRIKLCFYKIVAQQVVLVLHAADLAPPIWSLSTARSGSRVLLGLPRTHTNPNKTTQVCRRDSRQVGPLPCKLLKGTGTAVLIPYGPRSTTRSNY